MTFREAFMAYFPGARVNARLRGFAGCCSRWCSQPGAIGPTTRKESSLPGCGPPWRTCGIFKAMSSWCSPVFSASSEYEIRLAGVGSEVALAIGELADRLEVGLNSWLGTPASHLGCRRLHPPSRGRSVKVASFCRKLAVLRRIDWQEINPEKVLGAAPDRGKAQAVIRLFEKLTHT
ncbi:MAG TPA: hypothetical protein VF173_35305 [Thermoanaerobaculia bacterium]|nr:hypothetical protein [Thermoanaerobaculia bacterium]